MKIAIISDQHIDCGNRFEECKRILAWIAADVAQRGVDVIALGGDLFERRPLPEETKAAAEWLIQLAETAPVVGIYGNHDAPISLAVMNRLESRFAITFYDQPAVCTAGTGGGTSFALLPWPRKANLLALLPDAGKEGVELAAHEALQSVLRGLRQQLCEAGPDVPRIFLGHVQLRGSVTSTGQQMVGCDLELGLEDLALVGADFYGLGHIHAFQVFSIGDAPCLYPGSPRRCNFGEPEEKGYVIAEFDGRRLVGWERIPTPATPMILIGGIFDPDTASLHLDPEPEFAGAEIRMRYTVPADHRQAARAQAEAWKEYVEAAGSLSVKIEEEVEATTRARTPEVAAARTLPDKLQAFWTATGFDPGTRREALIQKVTALESEVAA